MNFGTKLKHIRKDNNLSQEEMAGILFTSQGNYSQYESNQRTPSIDLLTRLIEKFNLDANWLLCDSNEQTVHFNDNSSCNIAALKAENYHAIPSEKLIELEKKLELILAKLK